MTLIFFVIIRDRCFIHFFQEAELKVAAQLRGTILPVKNVVTYEEPRAITDAEKKVEIYRTLRRIRADAKYVGKREKKAREAAEENK